MDLRQTRQLIDACRPGSDDLRMPEMAALAEQVETDGEIRRLYERTQRQDKAIGAVMQDAPVPAGLVERMLAAVEAQSSPDVSAADDAGASPTPVEKSKTAASSSRWLTQVALAGIACAAAVMIAVGIWSMSGRTITARDLAQQAPVWFEQAERQFVQGDSHIIKNAAKTRPTFRDADGLKGAPKDWMRMELPGIDRHAVAFDWNVPLGEGSVVLFVARPPTGARIEGVSGSMTPLSGVSKNLTIGAWQSNGLLYVLVVRGGRDRYREFIESDHNYT